LNESTIRRFMKLASVDTLSDKFVQDKLQESETTESETETTTETATEGSDLTDQVDENHAVEADLEEMDGPHYDRDEEEDAEVELGADEEDAEVELDAEEPDADLDAEEAGGGMVSVDQLMSALEKALEDVLGQDVEVSQDDAEEEPVGGLEMDAELDLGPEEPEEEPVMEDEEYDVVEEIYSRIVQRLAKETKSK